MTEIENSVIDTYEEVVRLERLPVGEKELNELALLVAFQELRTAKFRSSFLRLEDQLRAHVAKFGATLEDIHGYRSFDEIKLKAIHLFPVRASRRVRADHPLF